jgi:hypothetical protein
MYIFFYYDISQKYGRFLLRIRVVEADSLHEDQVYPSPVFVPKPWGMILCRSNCYLQRWCRHSRLSSLVFADGVSFVVGIADDVFLQSWWRIWNPWFVSSLKYVYRHITGSFWATHLPICSVRDLERELAHFLIWLEANIRRMFISCLCTSVYL